MTTPSNSATDPSAGTTNSQLRDGNGSNEITPLKGAKPEAVSAIISNTCLFVWAILLAVIGMQAVSGNASTIILDIANKLALSRSTSSTSSDNGKPELKNGTDALNKYIENNYSGKDKTSIPPISIVLDRLQVNVDWSKADEFKTVSEKSLEADYNQLFNTVAKRLESLSDFSPEVSPNSILKINNNFMPLKFRASGFKEQEIDLPPEALLWIKARQAAAAAKKSQIDFLDLFTLLVILGGFGSWIYLVRRHIDPKITPKLDEYFYRPVLGMALAIAAFIVNITVHSFVSTASIKDVRRETLILLAFTAGLLSDKTYEFIESVTGEKLATQRSGGSANSGTIADSHNSAHLKGGGTESKDGQSLPTAQASDASKAARGTGTGSSA